MLSVAYQIPLKLPCYLGTIVNSYSCFHWKRECCCTVLVTPCIFFLAPYDLEQVYVFQTVSREQNHAGLARCLAVILSMKHKERETRENPPHVMESVSNFCEASLISLFWAPNGLNEISEARFEFPFIFFGKSTMTFLKAPSWGVLKSWYTGGDPEQGFQSALFRRPT